MGRCAPTAIIRVKRPDLRENRSRKGTVRKALLKSDGAVSGSWPDFEFSITEPPDHHNQYEKRKNGPQN